MSKTRDPSQYGNEKGVSVNHYLIKMINEILVRSLPFSVLVLTGGRPLTDSVPLLVYSLLSTMVSEIP